MNESSDLIVWRLERIEEKLDKLLKDHEERLGSLEHYQTSQKSRNTVFTAIGVPLLGLSLRDLWLLWFGR